MDSVVEMEPFEFEGRSVQLSERIGTVFGSKLSHATLVATVIDYRWHHLLRARVDQTETTKREFWIRTDNGEELPVQLANVNFPVADGQRVGAVSAEIPGADDAVLVLLINYSAKSNMMIGRSVRALEGRLPMSRQEKQNWLVASLCAVAAIAGFPATIRQPWLWLVYGGVALGLAFGMRRSESFRQRFERHLATYIDYSRGAAPSGDSISRRIGNFQSESVLRDASTQTQLRT